MSRFRTITTALAAVLLTAPAAFAYDLQTPGNDTKLSVYGFIYAETIYTTTGSTLQQPTAALYMNLPFDASARDKGNFTMGIQASRWGIASVTPTSAFGDITTKIEFDNNATISGNGVNFRHSFATVGNWLFGRTWSTFNDMNATVDGVDWQGTVGVVGYDTPRRPQIRYTFVFDKSSKLAVALENPAGQGDTITGGGTPDTKIPVLVAAYDYSSSWGHVNVGAVSVYHGVYIPATAGVGDSSYSKTSFGGRISGDVKFGNDDLVLAIYNGQGLGPWALSTQVAQDNSATKTIDFYTVTGWLAGYTHVFSPEWRGNVYASGIKYNANSNIPASQTGPLAINGTAIKQITQGAVNVFYNFNKNTQAGFEYFYEVGKNFGAQTILQQDGTKSDTAKNGRFEFVLQAKF
jgi:hypothetical protein